MTSKLDDYGIQYFAANAALFIFVNLTEVTILFIAFLIRCLVHRRRHLRSGAKALEEVYPSRSLPESGSPTEQFNLWLVPTGNFGPERGAGGR